MNQTQTTPRAKTTWTGQKEKLAKIGCNRSTLWKALIFLNNETDISKNGRAPGRKLAEKIVKYIPERLTAEGLSRADFVIAGRVKELDE